MRSIRSVAWFAAGATYLLIVLGGVVRITGSGMGCGDDWPLCNGRVFPPLDDLPTLIEYGHRLAAAAVSVVVVGLAGLAVALRHQPGVAGPGGPLRPALLATVLLIVQVMLGAVTVWLELPPTSVILHLGTAMALLAALGIVVLRSGEGGASRSTSPRTWRASAIAVVLAGAAVLLGALTANLDAAGTCMGFPLCNGRIWPANSFGGLAHIHWTHRLVAYALVLHLGGMVVAVHRRAESVATRRAALVAFGVTTAQVAIAAAMMLGGLQPVWRSLHVAAGTAVWIALVYLAWLARPPHGSPAPAETPPVAAPGVAGLRGA